MRERQYFTVLDEEGAAVPAVDYRALALESTAGEAVVVRRFIKLMGRGERLEPTGVAGTFTGATSGKTYFRLPS